jgi:hypothetical protein
MVAMARLKAAMVVRVRDMTMGKAVRAAAMTLKVPVAGRETEVGKEEAKEVPSELATMRKQ